jgi:hypothetical protein
MTKRCSRCRKLKRSTEFARSRRSRDGLQAWCSDCSADYAAGWRDRHYETPAERWRRDQAERDAAAARRRAS